MRYDAARCRQKLGHVGNRQIEPLHRLHRPPRVVAVVVINVGGPDQEIADRIRGSRGGGASSPSNPVMQCSKMFRLASLLQRRQRPFVAIERDRFYRTHPAGNSARWMSLEHRRIELGMAVKSPVISAVVTQSAASDWKFCTLVRNECGMPEAEMVRRISSAPEYCSRVAGRLQRGAGRERVHAVHHAGFFQRVPHRLVFRLQRIIPHRIDRPDQRDRQPCAATRCTSCTANCAFCIGRRAAKNSRSGSALVYSIGPLVIGLAERLAPDRIQQPRIGVDVGRNDHHLIDALHVHVAQSRFRLIRTGEVDISDLILRQRRLARSGCAHSARVGCRASRRDRRWK